MAISPWDYKLESVSPNGRYKATMLNAYEIAMGAPTSGTLLIEGVLEIDNCNPSIVWSSDSRYLAAPQWNQDRSQRLVVVDIENTKLIVTSGKYRVLELHNFDNYVINGIDSPIHSSEKISIDFKKMI